MSYDQNIHMPPDGRPRGKSPQRFVDLESGRMQRPRIPDDTWNRALARCQEERTPMGHVLTELLEAWLAGEIEV